jgi:hypothetical protein
MKTQCTISTLGIGDARPRLPQAARSDRSVVPPPRRSGRSPALRYLPCMSKQFYHKKIRIGYDDLVQRRIIGCPIGYPSCLQTQAGWAGVLPCPPKRQAGLSRWATLPLLPTLVTGAPRDDSWLWSRYSVELYLKTKIVVPVQGGSHSLRCSPPALHARTTSCPGHPGLTQSLAVHFSHPLHFSRLKFSLRDKTPWYRP